MSNKTEVGVKIIAVLFVAVVAIVFVTIYLNTI